MKTTFIESKREDSLTKLAIILTKKEKTIQGGITIMMEFMLKAQIRQKMKKSQ
jgi:hypothetical protein